MPTVLEEELRKKILNQGPLSLEAFHAMALWHPDHGYYRTQDVLGRTGDFVTAPEVSPLFGEVVGALCLQEWIDRWSASDQPISLVELGPGRGTLMADVLRVARLRPAFLEQVQVTLCEVSPVLRAQQEEALEFFQGPKQWIERLQDLRNLPGPLIILANEFFDIFPVQQWVQKDDSWVERRVVWDEALCLSPSAADETIREESPKRDAVFQELCSLIHEKKGLLWVADYGYTDTAQGETWQGIHRGQTASPLEHVGVTDLSAHVNFKRFVDLAEGCQVLGPLTQGKFLEDAGIRQRLDRLREKASVARRAELEAGYLRLTHPLQMGLLFKVLMVRA